ncbi:hypothetical protein FRE64_17270 (plasmid) [Euhalothece natronophila Z-M001]|uniref:Uncharacterized protein n=1 Tax=Euhalothece natronophila Z-M001 TaxID=522448 RepID=A0A5B8NT91_9CHRO|nr:hypothetical protein [Euhalothece natronophila]QDZ41711.1 hypothetical protein FRE64_17270 [Euhalothece natronophila Z-M001]
MTENRKKPALGNDPLTQGVYTRTDQETRNQKTDSRNQKTETSFLKEQTEEEREKVSLTLPPKLNDWLDDLVKKGRRNHGQKIPKQIWVQAAIELLQSLPVDWYEIDSVESLRQELQKVESRIQKMDQDDSRGR